MLHVPTDCPSAYRISMRLCANAPRFMPHCLQVRCSSTSSMAACAAARNKTTSGMTSPPIRVFLIAASLLFSVSLFVDGPLRHPHRPRPVPDELGGVGDEQDRHLHLPVDVHQEGHDLLLGLLVEVAR